MTPTPISHLWPKDTQGISALMTIPPECQKNVWQRRLSWKESDSRFGSFIDFLDAHGAHSTLSPESWQASLIEHLAYLPNQHFLFLIWLGTPPPKGNFSDSAPMWLPHSIATSFSLWLHKWQEDERLTQSLREAGGNSTIASAMVYRGIPLASAMQYNAILSLVLNAFSTLADND